MQERIIYEGFLANDNTNILPVRKSKMDESYEGKQDEQISICCYYLEGYLETLLNKYFSNEVQLEESRYQNQYEEFGWNYYTPEQIRCILIELEEHIKRQDDSETVLDFYARFINRMEQMLQRMDGYDLILFIGP